MIGTWGSLYHSLYFGICLKVSIIKSFLKKYQVPLAIMIAWKASETIQGAPVVVHVRGESSLHEITVQTEKSRIQ